MAIRNNDTTRNQNNNDRDERNRSNMTVRQAGQMGGQRVRELVEEGKEMEQTQHRGRRGRMYEDED